MDDLIGQTLGQYRIEAPLGAGGMGQVFRGVHKLLDRPAAIKVMLAHLALNPDFRSRFLKEAKAAAALKHPNIVEVYDFGEQDGTFYLVMELMNNGSLRTILRRNAGQPLPLALGLDLVHQAAKGLAAANVLHMVHRDIKPDNLLLTHLSDYQTGEKQNILKISDFGLARLIQGDVFTSTSGPIGTVAYMSPEQCQGKQLDGRSDLYSLGIVLYEVVTGYQPFQVNNLHEALYKHIMVPPPSPRQVRPDLPAMIEEIILRCLAKNPEERYATGRELAMALQRAMGSVGSMTLPTVRLSPEQLTPTGVTVLRTPEAAGTPSPTVSTLVTYTTAPIARVQDQSGGQASSAYGTTSVPGTQFPTTLVCSGHIGMAVNPRRLTITPGQPAAIRVTLTNLGTIMDWFTTTVEGAAPEWVQGTGQEIPLYLGTQETIELRVNVARSTHNLALEYPVTIRVRSREQPSESGTVQVRWHVLPFKQDALRLEPRRAAGRGSASYTVALQNSGNIPSHYELSGEDDEQQMAYQFGANALDLEPGSEARVPLAVKTRRRWMGRERRQPFLVHARPADSGLPLTTPGEFVNRALIPRWLASVALVVMLAGIALASLFGPKLFSPPLVAPTPTATTMSSLLPNTGATPTSQASATARTKATAPAQGVTVTPTLQVTVPVTPPPQQPGSKWSVQPRVTPNSLNSAAWGNSKYVAVGVAGTILTSPDGTSWSIQNSGTSNSLFSVTWTGSQFIAVGDKGTILTSPNGTNWSTQNSGSQDYFLGVTSSQSRIVVIGSGGTILTSSDGVHWSPQSSQGTTLSSIVWTGSQFIITGDGIYASPDGITWNTNPSSGASSIFSAISWSGSTYVAVGGTIYTSPDTFTWTAQHAGTSHRIYSVTWTGTHFIAMGEAGTILISPDGFSWALQSSVTTYRLNGATSSGRQYVIVGDYGTILTSP